MEPSYMLLGVAIAGVVVIVFSIALRARAPRIQGMRMPIAAAPDSKGRDESLDGMWSELDWVLYEGPEAADALSRLSLAMIERDWDGDFRVPVSYRATEAGDRGAIFDQLLRQYRQEHILRIRERSLPRDSLRTYLETLDTRIGRAR